MSISSLFHRPSRIIIIAAVLAGAFTGAAFWWQKKETHDHAPLVAALDAFTGEWKGQATIEGANGATLATLIVTRRYSWVGERQVVETRFHAEAEGYTTRAIQWIENGRLRAVVTGPEGMPHNFVGARTSEGILWTNLDRPDSDCLERLVVKGGKTSMQTASFTQVRLANISGLVGVAAILEHQVSPTESPEAEKFQKVVSRVDELERTLAGVVQESENLRAMLVRAEENRATAAAAASTPTEKPRVNRLEVNSTPAGLRFAVHELSGKGQPAENPLLTGVTPLAFESLPAGDYAVTVHGEGAPDVVHHVALRENADVVLFHRHQVQPATRSAPAPSTSPTSSVPDLAPDTPAEVQVARLGDIDHPPTPVRTVMPRLKGMRKYAGQQVNVSVLVDEHGIPRDATVADMEDGHLAQLCRDAVTRWRFKPATIAGRPVKVRVTVPFAVR